MITKIHVLMRDEKEGRNKQARSNMYINDALRHMHHYALSGYITVFPGKGQNWKAASSISGLLLKALHLEHMTLHLEHMTLHLEHMTLHLEHMTLHLEHMTLHLEHMTLHLEHMTR